MSRYISPVETITDLNGAPMVGAKLVFYETGTATLKTAYSDSGLSVPIANPVTAVSSDAGAIYPDIYLDGIYKVVQQDDTGTAGVADGAVLWTRDPVGDITTGNFEAWLNDTTYSIPEVIYASDDNYYISLVDANQGNEPSVSPAQWQLIPMKDMVGLTETQTLTNKTLTSPVIVTPTFEDASGDELIIVTGVATPVNEVTVTNAASGNKPSINQTGTDDVGLDIEGVELHNGVVTQTAAKINGAAGTNRTITIQTDGVARWNIYGSLSAETGSNAGTPLIIQNHADDGSSLGSAIEINRADGLCAIANLAPSSAGTAIAGQNAGDLGTEAWLVKRTANLAIVANTNYAGTDLAYSGVTQDGLGGNIEGSGIGAALTGTWKAKGFVGAFSGRYSATLFTKVAS